MNKIKRYEILYRMRINNPHPTTELDYDSPFQLLIAVLLSAQATDVSVNKATSHLFSVANTPEGMLSLGIDGIKAHIKSIGLFNSKAEYIIKTCRLLQEEYQGEIPGDRTALETLPGIGRKTANVFLNAVFSRRTIAVDRHVFRVANRTRFAVGKDVKIVEKKLLAVVPKEFKRNCHHWFIRHGRNTCLARKARCGSCFLEDLCEYDNKNI
ncbi:endonuclease III [Candidatus Steffania adelgidicola]|uniref:endonuclease III n=1 Tax=Candidatus Steffania adelgidicola TaxID=1076626 RepID=UPI001D024BB8|nr:endonuclease III [Candidatus Steffania adelgidicola]UDG79640.1 Endonuclease III [Candidatus Steffania adelgidicola]